MALNKTMLLNTSETGVNKDETYNCYIKILGLNGSKENINIAVGFFDFNSKSYLCSKLYSFDPVVTDSSPNFIKQGYEYLKTLDEFKDAVDC